MHRESLELDPSRRDFKASPDTRAHMPEPTPVRLIAVEDVHLTAAAGKEVELDALYVGLLRFEREPALPGQIVYKSETFRLRFDVLEPPVQRDDFRAAIIDVPSLADLEKALVERELPYERHCGLMPGTSVLVFQDPAGNWLQIGEFRRVG